MLIIIRNVRRYNHIRRDILFDEAGADALPMRFVAAAVLMSIITALSATALADMTRDANVNRFSGDLHALEARASAIYQQGGARDISGTEDNTGTKEVIRLHIPDGVECVVLGAMPPHTVGMPVHTNPYESNIIYYTNYKGVTRTMPSRAKFAALPGLDRPVVLLPGSYDLTMELVKNNYGTFVTLY